jgi:branched-chain amino acid aminotransferase
MNECFGKNFILNGELHSADVFDNSLVYEGESVYEVVRMVKDKPVFFNDHMERLYTSVKLKRKKLLADASVIRKDIINLTRSDRKKETNLKIVFNYKDDALNYLLYFIHPIYPTDDQYKNGVKGILFQAERKDPESKVINHKLRTAINNKLIFEGAYEALLVNEKNEITEGSRSNIFFLKNDTLITAPESIILNGITRKYILDICKENNINVKYECVKDTELADCDAVFMTGTSPMVLHFYCIGDIKYNTKYPIIEKLRKLYINKVEESIRYFR